MRYPLKIRDIGELKVYPEKQAKQIYRKIFIKFIFSPHGIFSVASVLAAQILVAYVFPFIPSSVIGITGSSLLYLYIVNKLDFGEYKK